MATQLADFAGMSLTRPSLRDNRWASASTEQSESSSSMWDRDALLQIDTTATSPTSVGSSHTSSPMLKEVVSADDLDSLEVPKVGNICFVGAGFVGGPTAAVIAFHNPDMVVNVVDLDAGRIAAWKSSHLPVHEAGLPKIVRIGRDGTQAASVFSPSAGEAVAIPARTPNLFFSTAVEASIAEADIVFICVNTPTKMYGVGAGATADLGTLELATRSVAQHAKSGAIVVEKSTVPCGTARMISDILAQMRPEEAFEVLSNPEFLAEGNAVQNLMQPDRVLIGSSKTAAGLRAAATLKSVYAAWVPRAQILTVNTFSSELTKLIANAMLAQRISSINAVSALCEELGADVGEVSRALGADARLGARFLEAGVGFGGSCFEKDIRNLAWLAAALHLHEVARYWRAILDMNEHQRSRFAATVTRRLNNTLRGKKVAVFGFAFKDGTNDTRNSVAVHVIAELAAERPAEIAVYDPGCDPREVEDEIRLVVHHPDHMRCIRVCASWREAVDGASAVCVTTAWPQFRGHASLEKAEAAAANRDNLHAVAPPLPSATTAQGPLTETDVLTLETVQQSLDEAPSEDPLGRLLPEPACPVGCATCATHHARKHHVAEVVDWAVVAGAMRQPSWVFDGRNAVNAHYLRKLGFRVHSIGQGAI